MANISTFDAETPELTIQCPTSLHSPTSISTSLMIPPEPKLSEERLKHRVTSGAVSSSSSTSLIACPPIFLTLGFAKNFDVLQDIVEQPELKFHALDLEALSKTQCASEAPNDPDPVCFWTMQPGGMIIIEYLRQFPTLKSSSEDHILEFLLEFAKHSASAPHGFKPSMRPRMSTLAAVNFAAFPPSSCNEATYVLLQMLPSSILDFFQLGKRFIDPPNHFISSQDPSVIVGAFARFNAIWQ